MRDPEPEPPRLVAPESLTHRSYEIINVHSFRPLKKIHSSKSGTWGLVGWNKCEQWRTMGELKLEKGSGLDHTWSYRLSSWTIWPLSTIPHIYALPYTAVGQNLGTTFIESPFNTVPYCH